MVMQPLELLPGVLYAQTRASSSTAWRETNLVRWDQGKLIPIAGWEKLSYSLPFASPVRRIHSWADNQATQYVAYLCEEHLYVEVSGDLMDVTPTGGIVGPADPLTDGGYGEYLYGQLTYGDERPAQPRDNSIAHCYTLGNWGDRLLAMTSADGRLLVWDPNFPSVEAAAVSGAPTGNRTFVVTPERHVMLFCENGERRRFAWSDQEDYSNWAYTDITSKAGFFDVEPSSAIVTAINTLGGTLMWTAVRSYLITSVGVPFIYAYTEIGEAATPVSAATPANTALGAYWFSEAGFWHWNGSSIESIDCPVWTWIKNDYDNVTSRLYAFGFNLVTKNEYWWFFCSRDGITCPDRYVIYNYRERWWSMGILERSAGAPSSYSSYPYMASEYSAYKHESGRLYADYTGELPFAETFPFNSASGDVLSTLDQMIVDVEGDYEDVGFRIIYAQDRSAGADFMTNPLTVRYNGFLEVRKTGRDFRIRIQALAADAVWAIGQHLMDLKPRGRK